MLPNIIEDFNGDLWIEFEDGLCKVHISLCFDAFTPEKKEELVGIAKNKKNAAVTGIVGKIRSALEDVFLEDGYFDGPEVSIASRSFITGYYDSVDHYSGVDYSCFWSLGQYRSTVTKEEHVEEWDELEKSVIASVADDVIVGVKGKHADIIIVKKFA